MSVCIAGLAPIVVSPPWALKTSPIVSCDATHLISGRTELVIDSTRSLVDGVARLFDLHNGQLDIFLPVCRTVHHLHRTCSHTGMDYSQVELPLMLVFDALYMA